MKVVELHDVGKWFVQGRKDLSAVRAVDDVSLEIKEGSFTVFVGPSGCGKSTVLNMIAGIISPTKGVVEYRGRAVDGLNKSVGYLTQADTTLPWRTVLGGVMLPLEIQGGRRKDLRERAEAMIETVGLGGFESHFPSQLSGGMRRRLALASCLVYRPETLLLDEPFGSLDAQTKVLMQGELLRIWREIGGATVIFVTHDLDEAVTLADEIVVFSNSPGRVIEQIHVDIPRPRDAFGVRGLPQFTTIRDRIWDLLRSDVAQTSQQG